jgi:signal transduction histidine kinase
VFDRLLILPALLALIVGLVLLFRAVTGPLADRLGRVSMSIRWKVLASISVMAALFIFVSMINFGAMEFMHDETHRIRSILDSNPAQARAEVDALENAQHGLLFSLTPVISLFAAVVALALGLAVAASVIRPVRRMQETMRKMAAGKLSEPVQVPNRDELGELARRINETASALARLQEAELLEEKERALRERAVQVTVAQEEERRRISRELHDGLGPSLAALGNRLRSCTQLVRADPARAEIEIEEVTQALRGHIHDIRRLIYGLRPMALDQLGLKEAVRQQVEVFRKETGIATSFEVSGEVMLEPAAEAGVFRIVQECLGNTRKHAGATHVAVELMQHGSTFVLSVRDDGRGFAPNGSVASPGEGGVGILSMLERAKLLGGDLTVESSPGAGCRVTLRMLAKEVAVGAASNPVS